MKKGLIVALMALITMVAIPAMQADAITVPDAIYYFTSDHITNPATGNPPGGGTPPFGEVDLFKVGSNVDFTVSLYNGSKFISTGSGDGWNFKFGAATGVGAMSALNGESLTFGSGGSYDGDGTGTFNMAVTYTGQHTGGGFGIATPITFEVANATIAQVTVGGDKGFIFVADIISGQTGFTGPVDASTPTSPVPEPATMLLLGSGLIGLWVARKKVKK